MQEANTKQRQVIASSSFIAGDWRVKNLIDRS